MVLSEGILIALPVLIEDGAVGTETKRAYGKGGDKLRCAAFQGRPVKGGVSGEAIVLGALESGGVPVIVNVSVRRNRKGRLIARSGCKAGWCAALLSGNEDVLGTFPPAAEDYAATVRSPDGV